MYQKKTKRQEQKENTRSTIYKCARQLFDEKGFDNVTIEEIAAKAGVSVGSIYFHFKSKPEIMAHYHGELDKSYLDYSNRREAALAGKSCAERLIDFIIFACATSADLGLNNVRVVFPYMMCNEEFGSSMLNEDRVYYQTLLAITKEGQETGELRRDISLDVMIRDLTVLVRGCIMDWCIHGGTTDISEQAKRMMDVYINGLRAFNSSAAVSEKQ